MATEEQEVTGIMHFLKCCKRSDRTSSVDPGLTNQPKKLWTLLSILLALVVLAVIAVGVYLLFFRPQPNPDLEIVEELKKYMNLSADPCVNFFNYACGGYIDSDSFKNRTEPITLIEFMKANVKKDILGLLRQPIEKEDPPYAVTPKKYFAVCRNSERLNKRGITPFLELMKTIGKFPLLDSSWDKKEFNLQDIITKMTLLGIKTAFEIIGDKSFKYSGYYYKIQCSAQSWSHENKDLMDWFQKVIELLGFPTDSMRKNSDLAMMIRFEKNIAEDCEKYLKDDDSSQLSEEKDHLTTLFDFTKLFANITPIMPENEKDNTGVRIKIVWSYTCLNCILKTLAQPENALKAANYLMKLLLPFTSALNTSFPVAPFNKFVAPPTQRDDKCYDETIKHFPEQMWRMYLDAFFHNETDIFVKEMVNDIREVINQYIEESIILIPSYRETHNETVRRMNVSVGLPEYLLDDQFLNDRSKAAGPITEYFEYFVAKTRYDFIQGLIPDSSDLYKNEFTRSFWNSWTDRLGPHRRGSRPLIFPVATFQNPVYNSKWRSSMKYGALGYITTGHILNQAKWVIMVKHLLIKQFVDFVQDCFSNTQGDEKVHVFRSIDHVESASILKSTYQAYRKSVERKQGNEEPALTGLVLNQDQLFFLSYAQLFCRSEWWLEKKFNVHGYLKQEVSVLGVLQNSVEFAEAYQCPPESPMNLKRKCPFF